MSDLNIIGGGDFQWCSESCSLWYERLVIYGMVSYLSFCSKGSDSNLNSEQYHGI